MAMENCGLVRDSCVGPGIMRDEKRISKERRIGCHDDTDNIAVTLTSRHTDVTHMSFLFRQNRG